MLNQCNITVSSVRLVISRKKSKLFEWKVDGTDSGFHHRTLLRKRWDKTDTSACVPTPSIHGELSWLVFSLSAFHYNLSTIIALYHRLEGHSTALTSVFFCAFIFRTTESTGSLFFFGFGNLAMRGDEGHLPSSAQGRRRLFDGWPNFDSRYFTVGLSFA